MADEDNEAPTPRFKSYIALKFDRSRNVVRQLRLASNLADALDFKESSARQHDLFSDEEVSPDKNEGADSSEKAKRSFFAELMFTFRDNLSSFRQLADIVGMMRPIVAATSIDRSIVKRTRERGHTLQKNDDVEAYGLEHQLAIEVSRALGRMRELDAGLAILPSAVLLSLVATFDTIIADAVKGLLSKQPEKITSSNRELTVKEVFGMPDLEAVREMLIDEEVDRILRGSHESQVSYLEKLIDTKIISHYERWPNFIEIFERRNNFAHAGGVVTQSYVNRCKAAGLDTHHLKLLERIELRPKYLHKSIDILIEFGVLFSFVAWRKLDADNEAEAFVALNEVAFEAIKQRRSDLAIWLLDFALHKQSRKANDLTMRMMCLNLANAYRKKGKRDRSEAVIDEMDWSASSNLFKIALCSLREDIGEVSRLLPLLANSNELRAEDFRTWPIFDWFHENAAIAEVFAKAFGEPLISSLPDTVEAPEDGDRLATQDTTLH